MSCHNSRTTRFGFTVGLLVGVAAGFLPAQPEKPGWPGNRHPDLTRPPLERAIARADNDCVPDEPYADAEALRVPVAAAVRARIHAYVLAKFNQRNFEAPTRIASRYGPLFRIRFPGRSPRDLYVFKHRIVDLCHDLVLFVHDRKTDAVTRKPVRFSTRWMSRRKSWVMMKAPLIRFDDLDQDGRVEIVCRDRRHNGTMYNAVLHRFLHVKPDLSFEAIFVLESPLRNLYEPDVAGQAAYLVRTIEKTGPRAIRVRVTLSRRPHVPGNEVAGWIDLTCQRPGTPFRETHRHVLLERYRNLLLYCCE